MREAIFGSTDSHFNGRFLSFERATQIFVAHQLGEVVPLINSVEEAAMSGSWVVLMLTYEAGPAFDRALKTHKSGALP